MESILRGIGIEVQNFLYRKESATTLIQAVVQVQVGDEVESEEQAYIHLGKYLGVDSKSAQLNANLAYILEAKDFSGASLYTHVSRDYQILRDSIEGLRTDLNSSAHWYVHCNHDDNGDIIPSEDLVYAPIDASGMVASEDCVTITLKRIDMLTAPLTMKAKYETRKP